ncbi:MAG TPA: SDR family oxidoreductase [Kofleriaceae bacterium]
MGGKHVVVTGASSGIGAAVCEQLEATGARITRVTRADCDLADPASRARWLASFGDAHVDALVSNAGEATYETPSELGADRWRALFELNAFATLDLALGLAPKMPRGAHVVAISSAAARMPPNARFAAYAATKRALEAELDALRLELDPRGIRVTAIAPGLVDTPLYAKVAGFGEMRDRLARAVPQWLSPADVAEAVVWVLARPAHVVVTELALLPSGQGR